MKNKVEKWFGDCAAEYENLSPEEREEAINHHVACLDKVVGDAMRKTITNYMSTVFIRLWGSDLQVVAEILDRYQSVVANDPEFAGRHLDPRKFQSL